MPIRGEYASFINDTLTYRIAANIPYETILPEYLTGDIERQALKYKVENINLTTNNMIASKYKADAFLHSKISVIKHGAGSTITVSMKLIDLKSNQIFATSRNESKALFSENRTLTRLINLTANEIVSSLN